MHHCTVTGEYQTEIKYLTQSKADYVDTANRQHYVQILADIDSQGNVTDRRLLSPFLGMNPLTLDDTTENNKDEQGHTHKLPIASLVKKGIVELFSGYDSDTEDMAATPKAIKGLKALIDAITRNLGNYIPNSKKSSAVDSNSADTVATSAAVKTAYDKGVEAKTAANNAQSSANAANNNANLRVSKSGDEMTGSLAIAGSQSGGFASGLMLKNKAGGPNTSVFVDFYQTDNIPRASMWMRDAGNNSTQIEFLNTPEGADWYRDSRQNVFTITSSGNLWSRAYGWLHDFFAKQNDINNVWKELNNNVMKRGDFISNWYPNHYNGTTVYKIRHLNLMITVMHATGGKELILPEHYDGHFGVWATDRGTGSISVNSNYPVGNNRVRVGGRDDTAVAVLVVGYKNV